MKRVHLFRIFSVPLLILLLPTFRAVGMLRPERQQVVSRPDDRHFDVVVVSGSSGGFGAALAAGKMGAHVALLEDTPVLGGMLSNGISNIDSFSLQSLSGIFDEFRLGVKAYYAKTDPNDPLFASRQQSQSQIDGHSHQWNVPSEGGRWEPHVAARLFKEMMDKVPDVQVFYNETPTGVVMEGHHILGVTTANSHGKTERFFGTVIIDATHEGDIAAWARVPYAIGQEASSPLEPHAGKVNYFNYTGEILPGSTGQASRKIPSSGYRLTVKVYETANGTCPLLSAPPVYKREDYVGGTFDPRPTMPHGKAELNVNPIGSELPGANWRWPDLKPANRGSLKQLYLNHALGFLYYMQHQPDAPCIGLANDEYVDNGNVPYRMFLREGRRIHGEATITEADINPFLTGRGLTTPFRTDSIAIGHYPIDAKAVSEKTDLQTPDKGEGDFFLANVSQPFQIPYGAIVPKNVDNLLVPVALSATHVAFSAIRMDPTWMAVGQAAGVAAVLSLRGHVPLRNVPLGDLQEELLRQQCRLVFFWDVPLTSPYFQSIQLTSLHAEYEGGDRRMFYPDKLLTRADLAKWIYHIAGYAPSVSNVHFSDVPWSHPQLREIETLYDNGILVAFDIEPIWKKYGSYNQARFGGFAQASGFIAFHPDEPVTAKELIQVLRLVAEKSTPDYDQSWVSHLSVRAEDGQNRSALGELNHPITRADASAIIAVYLKAQVPKPSLDSPITPSSNAGMAP